jgi:hypothetical protein
MMTEPAIRLPSELEIARNLQAGFRHAWVVDRAYEFAVSKSDRYKGVKILRAVDAAGVRRIYAPAIEPNLVEDFAQVDSEPRLKRFAERFGLLGFQEIAPQKPGPGGDPVAWALARAKEARVALAIQSLIQKTELRRELPKLLRQAGFSLGMPTAPDRSISRWRETAAWPSDPARTAWECLAEIINPHLRRIRFEILPGDAAELPDIGLQFDSLVDVIFWRLATQLRKLKPYICENCGSLAFAQRGSRRTCSWKCRKAKWKLEHPKRSKKIRRKHGALQKR